MGEEVYFSDESVEYRDVWSLVKKSLSYVA